MVGKKILWYKKEIKGKRHKEVQGEQKSKRRKEGREAKESGKGRVRGKSVERN